MTSEAQVEANRRNALKSTGPKNTWLTRRNALKHGLTAEKLIVLPYENPVEYEDLLERFHLEFQPETAVEEILIEQMATSIWRLRRVHRAERAEIQERLAYALLEFAKEESDRRSQASTGGYGGPLLTIHLLRHLRNGKRIRDHRESNGDANTSRLGMMIATR